MAIDCYGWLPKTQHIPKDGKREMSMEEFKQWLKRFDADGDGRISKEELRQALRSVGVRFKRWKARRALRSADADADANGFIDDDEIQNLVTFAEKHLGVKITPY
ncbi:probable calcium-binding protein CML18 [Telopea speciosissima]|uniref:probable calcium-binding protein CML18 n=1 Tax=Telopea speciosissima TaxID=54955 RepID=UPI001CC5E02C|nr:probable calcium-binding protein CML18 [Telopea speciosissima]